jgi:hypothetical protein
VDFNDHDPSGLAAAPRPGAGRLAAALIALGAGRPLTATFTSVRQAVDTDPVRNPGLPPWT